MNIEFQVCGLILTTLLLVFYTSHKKLGLYSEQVFFRMLLMSMLLLVLDIASVIAIACMNVWPMSLVYFICKAYVASIVLISGSVLSYLVVDVLQETRHRKFLRRWHILTLVEIIVVFLLPIKIFSENDYVYTYGPCTAAVYSMVAVNFILTYYCILRYKRRINPRRYFGGSFWLAIWAMAGVIQFFNSKLLLVGIASSLGMVTLYILLENPDANINRRFACFKPEALVAFLKQALIKKKKLGLLNISVESEHSLDSEILFASVSQMLESLKKYNEVLVFKGAAMNFVFVSSNEVQLNALAKEFAFVIAPQNYAFMGATVAKLTDVSMFEHVDDILRLCQYAKESMPGQKMIDVSEGIIANFSNRRKIEQEIKDALAENRVDVYFQPIYSVREKRFHSAEALARIRKYDNSLLMPSLFIPVAETTGSIVDIGYRIFEKTCAFLTSSEALSLGIDFIEVNLSVIQCEDEFLADRLIALMEKYKVDPRRINLEITETASIQTKEILLSNMKRLIEYGVTFSLDDFGKGESNLMYIIDMPVSFVKLDMDMSKAYFNTPKARHVVDAVEKMSHGLGLSLVAEGVETSEELRGMEKQGIDYIQGYYFSKPLSQKDFVEFLRTKNECS